MVSSAGAGFSSFPFSMRSDPRAFLRIAALVFPSRRRCVRVRRVRGRLAGRVSVFELLVSRREPSASSSCSGLGGWVSAPGSSGAGSDFSAATFESPSPQPSPVKGAGVWEPGSGRTRGSAPTAGVSPRLSVSRVEGAGVWEPGSGRDTWVRPYGGCVTALVCFSVEGAGGLGAGKRADTWVRPYDG